jgi:hypothetical protein
VAVEFTLAQVAARAVIELPQVSQSVQVLQ